MRLVGEFMGWLVALVGAVWLVSFLTFSLSVLLVVLLLRLLANSSLLARNTSFFYLLAKFHPQTPHSHGVAREGAAAG